MKDERSGGGREGDWLIGRRDDRATNAEQKDNDEAAHDRSRRNNTVGNKRETEMMMIHMEIGRSSRNKKVKLFE